MSDPTPAYSVPQPEHSGVKTATVAGALVALVAANIFLYIQVDKLNRELSKTREQLMTEIANVRETSSVTTASNRRNLQTLKEQLDTARHQASILAGQAKTDASARVDALARKVAEEQSRQEKQMTSQISEVKQVATTATARIAEVGGDVSNVKSEVASTKSELEKTISELKKVTGDLGVQSGYIATNSKELSALKRLGERNYFEFNLGKTKQPQRVGDIALMLKKADPKRNRYTIEVLADDQATEKRDKTINEPVQFLTSKGGRLPYEIVVNQVKKDQIVGYLATPKETVSRN